MTGASGFQVAGGASDAYERYVHVFMEPLADALLDRAALEAGSDVLDVACGPGLVTLKAAERVGPHGRVAGLDINAGMLEVARRRGAQAAPHVTWHQGSAQELPFGESTFDAVVAQQGIQFFPDLPAAVAEFARVARAGAVVAATSWTPIETSPYMQAQFRAMCEAVGTEPMASFAHAFRLTADDLRAVWAGAQLRDVAVEAVSRPVRLPPLAQYAPAHLDATPWGPIFRGTDADTQRSVVTRMQELLADHLTGDDGSVTVPFGTWLVSGTR